MENLAYFYLADAYKATAEDDLVDPWFSESVGRLFQGLFQGLFERLNRCRLSSLTYIRFMSLGVMLLVLSFTSNSWAMSRGDRGSSVSFLQQDLRSLGCFDGSITGVYDRTTEAGVRRCQKVLGLPANGVADVTTQQVLQRRLGQVRAQTLMPRQTATRFSTPVVTAQAFNTVTSLLGLKRGDRGIEVRELQKRLIVAGYSNVVLDSIFGAETEAAVKQFQIGYGFVPDGIADANTQQALNQKLYVVVVPKRNSTTLPQVKQIFGTAFEAPSPLGAYIHAGSYSNYDVAKNRVKFLHQSGIIDARVAYL